MKEEFLLLRSCAFVSPRKEEEEMIKKGEDGEKVDKEYE